jgi:hypothetical protein
MKKRDGYLGMRTTASSPWHLCLDDCRTAKRLLALEAEAEEAEEGEEEEEDLPASRTWKLQSEVLGCVHGGDEALGRNRPQPERKFAHYTNSPTTGSLSHH